MIVDVILDSHIRLRECPAPLMREITRSLEIRNPKFDEALRCGRWTGNIDEILEFYRYDSEGRLHLPRGFGPQFHRMAVEQGIQPLYSDHRRTLKPIVYEFTGKLRPYQQDAVDAILNRKQGVLRAGTGSGKTIIALAVVAERKQPTLIIVHTKELLDQWCVRVKQFLGIDAGKVGGGKFDIRHVTVATVQTARKHIRELVPRFGFLITDECHRCPCSTFLDCVSEFDCQFMLGLSATPYRRDKLTRLIYLSLGDQVHEVSPARLRNIGAILKPEVVTRETAYTFSGDATSQYSKMITDLAEDQPRNSLIVSDIRNEMERDAGTLLLVSDRTAQLEALTEALECKGKQIAVLTGKTPAKRREAIVEALDRGEIRILASTTSLIGEGFDCPGLSTLFLCTPIKFKGRLVQVVGRILRPKNGKRPRLYDYQDVHEGVLQCSSEGRQREYARMGQAI